MQNQRNKPKKFRSFTAETHARILKDLKVVLGCDDYDIPSAFRSPTPRPLKVGIYKDLIDRYEKADAAKLNKFLASYTCSKPYQISLKRPGLRVDIDGNEHGDITDAQKRRADKLMNIIDQNVKKRTEKRRKAKLRSSRPCGARNKKKLD